MGTISEKTNNNPMNINIQIDVIEVDADDMGVIDKKANNNI